MNRKTTVTETDNTKGIIFNLYLFGYYHPKSSKILQGALFGKLVLSSGAKLLPGKKYRP